MSGNLPPKPQPPRPQPRRLMTGTGQFKQMSMARHILQRVLFLIVILYVGACTFLLIEQNRLLYIGTSLPAHPPGLGYTAFKDASGAQIGWLADPVGTVQGTVVYFHGNDEEAWQAERNYGAFFTARGWRVVFPEYRGFDMRADAAPSHDAVIADAVAAMQLAHKDWPGTLWVAGNSLGAGIAAQAANAGGAQRVLLFVPWDRMSAVAAERYPIIPTRFLLWAGGTDYDSCAALKPLENETFIIYAGQDNIIPAHHAVHLAACLGLQPAHVLALPEAGHLDWYNHLTPAQWDNLLANP